MRLDMMHPRNMSKRQRNDVIDREVRIPKHLRKPIAEGATELIREFNQQRDLMVRGKIAFDLELLVEMIDRIDRARWATPPRGLANG